jgi:Lrp/AsnC family leucine-responsive transcriptional regulator
MNSKTGPDTIDWKILKLLQQNARMANTEIGKIVGLSQPAVTSRIQRLEQAGAIEGYSARVDPKKLGREINALIRIRTSHAHIYACLKHFEKIPEILEAYRVTGEDCFVVRASFDRMTKLENTIDALAKFGTVTTSMILATYSAKPITDSQ